MDKICENKKRLFLLEIIFFVIFSISGIYALADDVINNTESTVSTSYVDIKLEEYQNGEQYTKENEVVMPGEVVPLNTKINNLGINCYVRAKITYILNNTKYVELNYINGNYKNWTKKDDYYYYDSILNQNEVINLFDTIQIPNEIINESSGDKLIINILVEAVQAKNFDGKYIDIGDGFFNNLGGLLPGDSISDQITIDNNSSNKIEYFLSNDIENLTQEEIDLLEKVNITIKNSKGKELYNGKITKVNNILLGIYNSGSNDIINFTISIPSNLDNEYSKIATKIIWVFSVGEESSSINPKTWDLRFDWSITFFLLSALGLLIVMIIEKIKKDNIEKNKERRI